MFRRLPVSAGKAAMVPCESTLSKGERVSTFGLFLQYWPYKMSIAPQVFLVFRAKE